MFNKVTKLDIRGTGADFISQVHGSTKSWTLVNGDLINHVCPFGVPVIIYDLLLWLISERHVFFNKQNNLLLKLCLFDLCSSVEAEWKSV